MRKIYLVLPAYNEEKSLGSLLKRAKNAFQDAGLADYEVIVVNDGSKDKTLEVAGQFAESMPIHLVDHKVNMGLGPTIRDGLMAAAERSQDNDIIVTMDADDTHNPGLIDRMRGLIVEGYDVVIASRYQKGARIFGLSRFRKMISYQASILFRILLPIEGVRDFTCGFRAYNASVIKQAFEVYGNAFVDQDGFQVTVDTLIKLRKLNLVFVELPFVLRYDFKADESKMKVGKTMVSTLGLIAKRKFQKQ